MDYEFKIKELKFQPTLAVKTRTPVENLPQEIGNAYKGIMQYLGELGIEPVGMPFVISSDKWLTCEEGTGLLD